MNTASNAPAIATVTTCVCGYLLAHARRQWIRPAPGAVGAVSRMAFAALVAVALSGGLTVAVAALSLPGLSWLKVLFVVLTLLGPWVVLGPVVKAQRWRLDQTCAEPRTAQSLLHAWLTVQIAGTMTVGYLHDVYASRGWNVVFTVLTVLMWIAVLLLPAFRRETFGLWTPGARVVVKRASRRVSGAVFGLLWLWAYLSPMWCPERDCQARGAHGAIWALVFSVGSGWLIATALMQFGSMMRWLDDRSRNPGPPPPWLTRLVRAIQRLRSA